MPPDSTTSAPPLLIVVPMAMAPADQTCCSPLLRIVVTLAMPEKTFCRFSDQRGADCHAAGNDVLPCRDVERGAGGRAFRSNLLESARNSGAGYRPAGDELSSAAGYDCANRLAAGEHVLIARVVLTEDHGADRRAGRKDILPAATLDRDVVRDATGDDLKAAAGDDGAGIEDADRMRDRNHDPRRARDHPEIGDAAGKDAAGNVDGGPARRKHLAGAVDQDAAARRLDAAAVDDRAEDGAVHDGDAGRSRNRAIVEDVAGEG
jgi:hypothetical protein